MSLILAALAASSLVVTPMYRPDDVLDNRNNGGLSLEYWGSTSRWGFGAFASLKGGSRHTDVINAYCYGSTCTPGPGELTYVNPRARTFGLSVAREVTGRPWVKDAGHWRRTHIADPLMALVTVQAGVRRMDFPDAGPVPGQRIPTASSSTRWFVRPVIAARWYPVRVLALEMGASCELGNSPGDYRSCQPHFAISTQF